MELPRVSLMLLSLSHLVYLSLAEVPSCREFDVDIHSMKYQMDRQRTIIENLKKIEVEKPAFGVNQPRFIHYSESQLRNIEEKPS